MGADWLKFQIRPDANLDEIRELTAFVNENFPHGRFNCRSNNELSEEEREKWNHKFCRLEEKLLFPHHEDYLEHFWGFARLTDPLDTPIENIEICRVYVISHNDIFPSEWRDEAYRIILPEKLPKIFKKWKQFIKEVNRKEWQQYLYDLYLYECIADEHQSQEFEYLYSYAEDSLELPNAWAQKERLFPARDSILNFNAYARLQAMQKAIVRPEFSKAVLKANISPEQLEMHSKYWELRRETCSQIKNWNRFVPQKYKIQYPTKISFEEFLARANDSWLMNFFIWCQELTKTNHGLLLWA